MLLPYLQQPSTAQQPDIAHQRLMDLLTDYWFVGGMPEAVNAWLTIPKSQSLPRIKAVKKVKHNLLRGINMTSVSCQKIMKFQP
jgi:predicted AAA+ superfamily ATPase